MSLVKPVLPRPYFAVAPMMDWTDRHCRYFHRQLSQHALLYTEMIVSAAIRFGQRERLLGFEAAEHPVALQLGGSDPAELALAARIGEQFGYKEINLNCGCPSDRVQSGAFGACLMKEPDLVASCYRAMADQVGIPVTIKHRIGLGRDESEQMVTHFVGTIAEAGCRTFIVHARNAWLEGLSPKENRLIPPLRYDVVHRLATEFPDCQFWLNGGLTDHAQIAAALGSLPGVMVGRAAYDNPWILSAVDADYARYDDGSFLRGDERQALTRESVVDAMVVYAERQVRSGVPLRRITRHMLGLFNGLPGARAWRRTLSDAGQLAANDPALIERALGQMSRHAA
ncbi:MAG: tRNA dihydrouridine(20/20a) synthase DusA [Burkholderiaceae bacterium]